MPKLIIVMRSKIAQSLNNHRDIIIDMLKKQHKDW